MIKYLHFYINCGYIYVKENIKSLSNLSFISRGSDATDGKLGANGNLVSCGLGL